MTKEEFFNELESRLNGLPEQEMTGIRTMYMDFFREGEKNGRTEQEIVQTLLTEFHFGPTAGGVLEIQKENKLRAWAAALSLGFFNLVFVLWVLIALFSVLLSLLAVSAAMFTGPLWVLAGSGLPGDSLQLQTLVFCSLALLGAGLLLGLGSGTASVWLYRGVRAYIRLNVRLIKGE